MDTEKFRERKLDVQLLKNGELKHELHDVDFTNDTWRQIKDILQIEEPNCHHRMKVAFYLFKFKDINCDNQRSDVTISIQKHVQEPARYFILKVLYGEVNQVRGFSLDYWPIKPTNVEMWYHDGAACLHDSVRDSIMWYARELQWHLHTTNNREFDETKFIDSYFHSVLPLGGKRSLWLLLLILIASLIKLPIVMLWKYFGRRLVLACWPDFKRWRSSRQWKKCDSLSKDVTQSKVHLYPIFNGGGMTFKFEKPHHGNTYWTSYAENDLMRRQEGLVVSCTKVVGTKPQFIYDCEYLGYIQTSPSEVVQITKQLESKIERKAFPFIVLDRKDWTRALFYTLTARYDLHYDEELPLRCDYPLVKQVSKSAVEKKIEVGLWDEYDELTSIETDITLHNLKELLDRSTALVERPDGDLRAARLFRRCKTRNRWIQIVFYEGYNKTQAECYTIMYDLRKAVPRLHVIRDDHIQFGDDLLKRRAGTTFTNPRAVITRCVRTLFELMTERTEASNLDEEEFSEAFIRRLWPIPSVTTYSPAGAKVEW